VFVKHFDEHSSFVRDCKCLFSLAFTIGEAAIAPFVGKFLYLFLLFLLFLLFRFSMLLKLLAIKF